MSYLSHKAFFDERAVVEAILGVLRPAKPSAAVPIEHHTAVTASPAHRAAVLRALDEGIGSYGAVERLERALEGRCRVGRAIAVSNGTAALTVALRACGVGPGDMVLVPSLTFAAVASAVTHVGAEPLFLDSIETDFGLSPYKLDRFLAREVDGTTHRRSGRRVGAIVAVHLLGHPMNIRWAWTIAAERGIPLVEDASQALGSVHHGGRCGSFGEIAVMSFNTNKIITAGGGGAILTSNQALAERCYHLATTARVKHAWEVEHHEVAWNARMPNMVAALLEEQMKDLTRYVNFKRNLAQLYQRALKDVPGVAFHAEPEMCLSNYWLSTIKIDARHNGTDARTRLLKALHDHGVRARAIFKPMHMQPMYAEHTTDNPIGAVDIYHRAVCLPSGVGLAERLA